MIHSPPFLQGFEWHRFSISQNVPSNCVGQSQATLVPSTRQTLPFWHVTSIHGLINSQKSSIYFGGHVQTIFSFIWAHFPSFLHGFGLHRFLWAHAGQINPSAQLYLALSKMSPI